MSNEMRNRPASPHDAELSWPTVPSVFASARGSRSEAGAGTARTDGKRQSFPAVCIPHASEHHPGGLNVGRLRRRTARRTPSSSSSWSVERVRSETPTIRLLRLKGGKPCRFRSDRKPKTEIPPEIWPGQLVWLFLLLIFFSSCVQSEMKIREEKCIKLPHWWWRAYTQAGRLPFMIL